MAAWRDSPTRLREDAATEADLVRAGYRDRLLTELAQNAADAAAKAGTPGRITVWLDGRTMHIANTGAPLDISGVHALTALRASGKADPLTTVGRFGVGFTAVLAVSDDIEIRSTTGSLAFSRTRTREAMDDSGIRIPGADRTAPASAVAGAHGFEPPVLRLAWPVADGPVDGADTEIVLHLRAEIDSAALLAGMRAEAADLLLELPALQCIRLADEELTSSVRTSDHSASLHEVRVHGPGNQQRTWWQFQAPRARWLIPVRDGRPIPAAPDVLRAPTRSDEELSLPALLIADIAMQPDRRRLLPGARITELATGYADFAASLPPADRLVLVPTPGFARSEADGLLREALIRELQTHPWLPVVPTTPTTPEPPDLFPTDTAGLTATTNLPDPADLAGAAGPADAAGLAGAAGPAGTADLADTPGLADTADHAGAAGFTGAADPAGAAGSAGAAGFTGAAGLAGAAGSAGTADLADTADHAGAAGFTGADGLAGVAGSAGAGDLEGTADLGVAALGESTSPGRGGELDSGLGGSQGAGLGSARGQGAGVVAVPTRASVFAGLTGELAGLLGDVVGPLVVPELSGRGHMEALGVLDVHRLGLARLAELSSGLERSPGWWRELYAALEPFVVDPLTAEELGALAVPLADGRLVTGPRTVVLDDQLEVPIPVHWARLVHPEAAHPLLARLGARAATAADLLADPGLHAELAEDPGDEDLVDAVLRLAVYADPNALPDWLGQLELPDSTGELLPADELLLPGAPLAELLVADAPFGTVAEAVVDGYGAQALRAIGVGWDFGLVAESDPTGPDHHLDDEELWWSGLPEDPPELIAVRDLDLVDDAAWPQALRRLVGEPRTRRLLADRDGYTPWWLRGHARVAGIPLGLYRHPADPEFDGLLPEFAADGLTRQDIDALRTVLADPDTITVDLATALLDALADPASTPTPDVVSRTHARLAAAFAAGQLELADLVLPDRVRALSGAVVDAADALILDQPWFGLALPPDRLVLGETATAPALATLLDLPLVSESVTAEIIGAGRRTSWSTEPVAVVLRQLWSLPPQDGELVLHTDLRVRLHGAAETTVAVPWWREGAATHIQLPRAHG